MTSTPGTAWTSPGRGASMAELAEALWAAGEAWCRSAGSELSYGVVLVAAIVNVQSFVRMLTIAHGGGRNAIFRAFLTRTNLSLTGAPFHRTDLVRFLTGELEVEAGSVPPGRSPAERR